jgi:hypothetical protein
MEARIFTAIKGRVEPWSLLPLRLVVRLLLLAHAGQQLWYGRHMMRRRNRPEATDREPGAAAGGQRLGATAGLQAPEGLMLVGGVW